MSFESIASDLGVYVGTLVVCFAAGLIPVINAEVWLVAVTLMVKSATPLPAVVVLAALGMMLAKVLLFYAARGAVNLPTGRYQAKLEKARLKIEKWKKKPLGVLFVSATIGLPPFYVVSLLAGALDIRLRAFCVVGMIGRTARFAVIVAIAWAGAS